MMSDNTQVDSLRNVDTLENKDYKTLEDHFHRLFKEKCEYGTIYSREIGNIYTGSLYLGLASYLSHSNTYRVA